MTIGATLDLQRAIVTRLKASADLQALIGNPIRLFEEVPPDPQFKYVTIGPVQRLPDLAECIDGAEMFLDFHVFSRSKGYPECKAVGSVLIEELHDASLTLAEHRCVLLHLSDERYFIEPDNQTKHGVITFRALVEPLE